MKNLKLKAARAAKDLSQEQLAQLVGVTRQTIGMIEAGNYNPTLNLCIAKHLTERWMSYSGRNKNETEAFI